MTETLINLSREALPGVVLQDLREEYTAWAGPLNAILKASANDTAPAASEGVELVTVSITPRVATSKLVVSAQVFVTNPASMNITASITQSGVTNAIGFATTLGSTNLRDLVFSCEVIPGSTSPLTFGLRVGTLATGYDIYINGNNLNRLGGGTVRTYIEVREISA